MHQHTHTINWEIKGSGDCAVERYCTGCGKKVEFKDSGVRRHNANGKNVTQFAIYKCEKGHTWNQRLQDYKAKAASERSDPMSLEREGYKKVHFKSEKVEVKSSQPIDLEDIIGIYEKVYINIIGDGHSERVDKVLAEVVLDMSRAQIKKAISKGFIVINDSGCKVSAKVRKGDVVGIYPNEINGICRL